MTVRITRTARLFPTCRSFTKMSAGIGLLQLPQHFQSNHLFSFSNPAYRPRYSTETALFEIASDFLTDLLVNQSSLLSLLDLSTAFDTVDHSILYSRDSIVVLSFLSLLCLGFGHTSPMNSGRPCERCVIPSCCLAFRCPSGISA